MKHTFKISIRLFAATSIMVLFMGLSVQQKKDTRPNIIFILADDMGYSDIGAYGGEVQTPNLDALAANGIKMRNFYNNARCCPTRASLLTGQYPHKVGIGHMVTLAGAAYEPGSYQGFLDPAYPTIAEALKKAGYGTYMSGKWHVGERKEHWPIQRGFDRYFGLISGASSFYEITPQEKGKRYYALDNESYKIPSEGYYATDAFTDHALQFLQEHREKKNGDPYFLYLAYTAPHFPLHALEPEIAKYEAIYSKGWDAIRKQRFEQMKAIGYADERYLLSPKTASLSDWKGDEPDKQWVRKMAVYAAMTDRMDQNIGRLIETLKQKGEYENTIIVFLSDNGACAETVNVKQLHDPSKKIGEKGSYATIGEEWANASNTPFRLYKHHTHEGGINTPCIIHWPAKIKAQKGFKEGVGHVIDLMPTALELAGVSTDGFAGKSFSYLWRNKVQPERTYCWEHEGNKAILKGSWKLVRENKDLQWELYDLKKDPVEMHDLAAKYPDKVQTLLDEYMQWEKEMQVKEFKGKPYGMSN